MALVCTSRNCFTAFNAALEAIKRNDTNEGLVILQSVHSEAKILQTEARILYNLLLNVGRENEAQVENLTKEINNLYEKEQQLKQKENNLRIKITGLEATREEHAQIRNAAQRRYEAARAEQQEAERRFEEFKILWWVPIVGQVLLIRELIENNRGRAQQAERNIRHHSREMENADREINSTNADINQVHERIEKMKNKMKELKQERDRAHKELGEYKAMTTVALEVLSFSEVLINLTGEASLKTDYLERIMALATKRNVDIKRSRGMKTAVDSFQDSWVNIFDLMNSNRIAILNDRRLVSIQEARYANTYLFDILIVCLAVLMVLLFTFVFPK